MNDADRRIFCMYIGRCNSPVATTSPMKFKTPALVLFAAACIAAGSSGCSLFHHHQPKSSWKIINEGDDNPFITDAPTRAGTVERTVDAGSDSKQRQQQQQQNYQEYQRYQQFQQQQAQQPQQQSQQPQQQSDQPQPQVQTQQPPQ